MANTSMRSVLPDIKLEDGDHEKIRHALAILSEAGLDESTMDSVSGSISISHCEGCFRFWLNRQLHYTPSWVPDIYGRGRRVDTNEIHKKLTEAGHKTVYHCEDCILKSAEVMAKAVLTLANKDMRRFFKLYAHKIEQLTYNRGYQDSLPYRFHVAVATSLVRTLPAKQRKSFATLSEILAKMEIL